MRGSFVSLTCMIALEESSYRLHRTTFLNQHLIACLTCDVRRAQRHRRTIIALVDAWLAYRLKYASSMHPGS